MTMCEICGVISPTVRARQDGARTCGKCEDELMQRGRFG